MSMASTSFFPAAEASALLASLVSSAESGLPPGSALLTAAMMRAIAACDAPAADRTLLSVVRARLCAFVLPYMKPKLAPLFPLRA